MSCSNLSGKLTSLKFQVQLPIYNVHAIMHGRHDLTGNEDKSLKLACVAGAKRGGGREKGKREGSACSKSLCFCITPTNFLVIRLRLLSIKCRYTRQSERKAEPCGYAEIYLICRELTLHKYLSKREILTSGQPEI